MSLLPDNPTAFDYFHAIRAVASRSSNMEIFKLADARMERNGSSQANSFEFHKLRRLIIKTKQ